MTSRRLVPAAVALLALAGCTAPGSPAPASTAAATPDATATPLPDPTPTPTPTPTPEVPGLGAWTATCTAAEADATAFTDNILSQDAFRGQAHPSDLPAWPEALATAVKPLDECPTDHLLAVSKVVAFGTDQATEAASTSVVALARGRTLVLTGSQIGRLGMGTSQAAAEPVLTAIMGAAKTSTQSCEASSQAWTVLQWGDLRVSFLRSRKGAVLDGWNITPRGSTPSNLTLQDDLPLRATFAQLKAYRSGLTQVDAFSTGAGPWIAEVRPNLRYHWTEKNGRSFRVEGGAQRGCE